MYIFATLCPYTHRHKKWKKSDHLIAKNEKRRVSDKKAEMKINGKNMQIFHSRGKKKHNEKFFWSINENLPSFENYNDLRYTGTTFYSKRNYGSYCQILNVTNIIALTRNEFD